MSSTERDIIVRGCPDCGSFDVLVNQSLPIGVYKCARCGRAYDPNRNSYTDRDLIELAIRAPAVPEWFKPDMMGHQEPTLEEWRLSAMEWGLGSTLVSEWRKAKDIVKAFEDESSRQKTIQWPKAYARMVLEAM